jgi:hypothetical protein
VVTVGGEPVATGLTQRALTRTAAVIRITSFP